MKTYQTPEILLLIVDRTDLLRTSTEFVAGSGSDDVNQIGWWI